MITLTVQTELDTSNTSRLGRAEARGVAARALPSVRVLGEGGRRGRRAGRAAGRRQVAARPARARRAARHHRLLTRPPG